MRKSLRLFAATVLAGATLCMTAGIASASTSANPRVGGASAGTVETAASSELNLLGTKSDLDQIKQQVASGKKAAYWSFVQNSWAAKVKPEFTPNWSSPVSYKGSTFDPKSYLADNLDSTSVNAQGEFIQAAAQNTFGCALKWYMGGDQACGTHAINVLSQWSQNFTTVNPLAAGKWEYRGNQIRLYSSWSVVNFTKAASLLWSNPAFTPALKTQFADWLWKTWLMQHATLTEDLKAPGEVLGQQSWNGRNIAYEARMFAGLTMKAAGNPNGEAVISDDIAKMKARLPENLYFGTGPWHQTLGSPWPTQALPFVNNYYATADNMRTWWKIDNSIASPFSPQMVGITVETGRDVGHQQMGTGALADTLTAIRINGYGDSFSPSQMGPVLLQLGEKEAGAYNEALDAYWASPSSYPFKGTPSIDGLSCGWQPNGWSSYHFATAAKSSSCPASSPAKVSFVVGGGSADSGWESLRAGLKQNGYATPQMDRLVDRLRGTGTSSSTNAAGHGPVGLANSAGWDPLFALDYK